MFSYNLSETRLRQTRFRVSAANADQLDFSTYPVPEGKVWIIHGFGYYPSVAETQTIAISKYVPGLGYTGLLNPVSLALNSAVGNVASFIEQGMEHFLFPGEYLNISRGNHTAGSTMTGLLEFTEIDLPLYTYDEPQTVKRQERALSSIRSAMAGGGRGIVPPTLTRERGSRSGPLEK